jgi:hypothetical protein
MTVTLAQVVLLALIIGLGVYSFVGRSVTRDRALLLILAVIGGVLVVWPGLSTSVARVLGIGRGADLVFYLFVVFCLFRFVSISADKRRMEERFSGLVRELALLTVRPAPADGQKAPGALAAERRDGDPAPLG